MYKYECISDEGIKSIIVLAEDVNQAYDILESKITSYSLNNFNWTIARVY